MSLFAECLQFAVVLARLKPQTTQTRAFSLHSSSLSLASSQVSSSLAHGLSLRLSPLASCCRSRFGAACSSRKQEKDSTKSKLATTKRLRQQPAVRRERLVAAGVARVCVVCVFLSKVSKAKQETQSRKSTDEHKLTTQLIDITTNILLR